MFKELYEGWLAPAEFAKVYVRGKGIKKGKPGVSRPYIWQLIKQEIEQPGSTDIDVLAVDGVYFARLKGADQGQAMPEGR